MAASSTMNLAPKGHYFDRDAATSPLPCLITTVRSVWNNPGNPSRLHILHQEWVIDCSISDCGYCRVGDENAPWLPRTPRVVHLYPPGTKFWENGSDRPLPISSAYIIFRGGENAGLRKFATGSPAFGRFNDVGGKIGEILDEMATLGTSGGDASFWLEQALLFRLFDYLHTAIPVAGGASYEWTFPVGGQDCADAAFRRQVNELLSERLGETIGLEEMASALRVSSSTLSHRYRKVAGESPMQTLAKLRINTAKALLLKGELIKSVAARTGFFDEFHFSKAFKRATGVSPSEYRKGGDDPPLKFRKATGGHPLCRCPNSGGGRRRKLEKPSSY